MKIKSLVVSVLLLSSIVASAAYIAATPVRIAYATLNISSSAYTQLIANTPKTLKGVLISNSGTSPMALAFGSAGSEVAQLVFPQSVAQGTLYPVSAAPGQRVSIISLGSSVSSGELELNFLYN